VAAIFVGSFTLTMTNGLGDGMHNYVESQVKNIEGERVIMVHKKIEQQNAGNSGTPTEYKEAAEDDALQLDPNSLLISQPQMEAAARDIEGVRSITPRYDIGAEYIYVEGSKKYRAELGMMSEGVTQKTEAGDTITGPGQIVIPLGLARALSGNISDLIGKDATLAYRTADADIRTIQLKIMGVATKGFMTNYNSFVHADTAKEIYASQRRAGGEEKFRGFSLQMASNDPAQMEAAKKKLLEKGLEGDTIADTRKRTYDAISIFKTAMNLFALVALLAASFGIINTLVIAVLERTKEIGLQKALGMSRAKIFAIFSLESVFLGIWGAVLGTIGGIVAGTIANKVLVTAYASSFEGFSLFAFRLTSIATVMLLVCGISFLAGVLPALRASRLNPIDSLRYE
jgi:putative ABC transport system permease protein